MQCRVALSWNEISRNEHLAVDQQAVFFRARNAFIDTCDYLAFCLLDCRPPRDRVSDWAAKKRTFQRLPELTFHLLQPLPFIRQRAPKKKKPLAPRRSGQRRKQKVLRQPPALIPFNSSIHLCRKINNATRSIVYTAIGRVLHCKVFALFSASSTVLFKHGIK